MHHTCRESKAERERERVKGKALKWFERTKKVDEFLVEDSILLTKEPDKWEGTSSMPVVLENEIHRNMDVIIGKKTLWLWMNSLII